MKYLQQTRDIIMHMFPKVIKYELPLYYGPEFAAFKEAVKKGQVEFKFDEKIQLVTIFVSQKEQSHDEVHLKGEVASKHFLL